MMPTDSPVVGSTSRKRLPRGPETSMANKRFRVGTFNLYNLASPGAKLYRGIRYTDEQYQAKTQWIAEQLRRIDGDIVGFQEIFDGDALQVAVDQSTVYKDATVIVGETDGQKPVVGLVSPG